MNKKDKLQRIRQQVSMTPAHFVSTSMVKEMYDVVHDHDQLLGDLLGVYQALVDGEAESTSLASTSTKEADIYYNEGREETYGVIRTAIQKILEGYL